MPQTNYRLARTPNAIYLWDTLHYGFRQYTSSGRFISNETPLHTPSFVPVKVLSFLQYKDTCKVFDGTTEYTFSKKDNPLRTLSSSPYMALPLLYRSKVGTAPYLQYIFCYDATVDTSAILTTLLQQVS